VNICLKKHPITLLLNASKTYDRKVIEGVGNYFQFKKVLQQLIS